MKHLGDIPSTLRGMGGMGINPTWYGEHGHPPYVVWRAWVHYEVTWHRCITLL